MQRLTQEKEIYAMALWVEKHHGENGWLFIAQKQDELLAAGQDEGANLWLKVGESFEKITAKTRDPRYVN
ncbi:MAG: hypothetical protein V2I43_12195 [Parvularcula sp.]|nr:hypothetical protein [Parvularcula sp.]